MKDRKINLDRPQLTGNEIMAGKNFEAIVQNHQFMSKPFYKQTWFFGTTGLASLGIIIGSTLAFQTPPTTDDTSAMYYTTDAPPDEQLNGSRLIVLNEDDLKSAQTVNNSIQYQSQNNETIEKTITPEEKLKPNRKLPEQNKPASNLIKVVPPQKVDVLLDVEEPIETATEALERNKAFDLYPRISDKIGGTITRSELLDNKGITTEGDVNVIHFELHLIDGLGGKVYSEDGNQLNKEMKDALNQVGQGETIYFENIRGQVKNGTEVRLNPLRYVLLN